jgi:ribulose-phosphate 3-epimerase
MLEVIPTVLTNDPQELKQLINQAEEAAERVQIDVIDGQFAENKTVDPNVFQTVETNLKLDFHLMTKEPVGWVERVVRVMADRIIGQIEMMQSQIGFVEKVMENGVLVGLGVDLDTPVSKLDLEVLTKLDVVLLMSVPAGFGGQKFDKKVIEKVKTLEKTRKKEKLNFRICIDGGVTLEVVRNLVDAGADEVSVGRLLYKGDLKENIQKFKEMAEK